MGKVKNLIAGGLAVLGSVVPGHAAINSEKINTQKDTTNQEIVDVFVEKQDNSTIDRNQNPEKYTGIYAGFETNPEGLDWQKIYNINVSEVPTEVLKYGMLRKMNEIRKAHGLKPLKYDKNLEKVAQDFADDERNPDRWNNPYPHADSKGRGVKKRLEDAGLIGSYIELVTVDYKKMGYGENMGSISGHTINSLYEDWMNSPGHRAAIISKYHTATGFGISVKGNVIVHEFGNVKK